MPGGVNRPKRGPGNANLFYYGLGRDDLPLVALALGEEDLAVQIYRDLFHVSEEEARQAVDQLARSIREKNGF